MMQARSRMICRSFSGVAILVSLAAAACTPSPPSAAAPPSPEQSSPPPEPRGPQAEVSQQILIEPILQDNGDPTQIQQSGGSDLCDPSADPEARRRAGIDCEALAADEKRAAQAAQAATPHGAPADPLLRPGSREQRAFESLDLGEGVPSTVILNQ